MKKRLNSRALTLFLILSFFALALYLGVQAIRLVLRRDRIASIMTTYFEVQIDSIPFQLDQRIMPHDWSSPAPSEFPHYDSQSPPLQRQGGLRGGLRGMYQISWSE